MDYGNLHLRINEILQEKGISKNQICKDLDIPRTNFNKYCRDGVCRFLDFNVSNSRRRAMQRRFPETVQDNLI